jgi:hypothetical protein
VDGVDDREEGARVGIAVMEDRNSVLDRVVWVADRAVAIAVVVVVAKSAKVARWFFHECNTYLLRLLFRRG